MTRRGLLQEGDVFTSSRLRGEYVVTKTVADGGGGRRNDSYPNGHHVHARRLKDGRWDPEGKKADFWQTGCFVRDRMIEPKEIEISRKMEMSFA